MNENLGCQIPNFFNYVTLTSYQFTQLTVIYNTGLYTLKCREDSSWEEEKVKEEIKFVFLLN